MVVPTFTSLWFYISLFCLSTSGTSELFATCSEEDIRLWHIDKPKELLRITVPNMTCNSLNFMADGHSIISGRNHRETCANKRPELKIILFLSMNCSSVTYSNHFTYWLKLILTDLISLSSSVERWQDSCVCARKRPPHAHHSQRTQDGCDGHRWHQELQEDCQWRGRGASQYTGH